MPVLLVLSAPRAYSHPYMNRATLITLSRSISLLVYDLFLNFLFTT